MYLLSSDSKGCHGQNVPAFTFLRGLQLLYSRLHWNWPLRYTCAFFSMLSSVFILGFDLLITSSTRTTHCSSILTMVRFCQPFMQIFLYFYCIRSCWSTCWWARLRLAPDRKILICGRLFACGWLRCSLVLCFYSCFVERILLFILKDTVYQWKILSSPNFF